MRMIDVLERQRAVISLFDAGKSTLSIALEFGLSIQKIRYLIDNRGKIEETLQRIAALTPEEITEFRNDYVGGIEMKAMQEKYNMSYNAFVFCGQQHMTADDLKARAKMSQGRYRDYAVAKPKKPIKTHFTDKESYAAKDYDAGWQFEDEQDIHPADAAPLRMIITNFCIGSAAQMCVEGGTA